MASHFILSQFIKISHLFIIFSQISDHSKYYLIFFYLLFRSTVSILMLAFKFVETPEAVLKRALDGMLKTGKLPNRNDIVYIHKHFVRGQQLSTDSSIKKALESYEQDNIAQQAIINMFNVGLNTHKVSSFCLAYYVVLDSFGCLLWHYYFL